MSLQLFAACDLQIWSLFFNSQNWFVSALSCYALAFLYNISSKLATATLMKNTSKFKERKRWNSRGGQIAEAVKTAGTEKQQRRWSVRSSHAAEDMKQQRRWYNRHGIQQRRWSGRSGQTAEAMKQQRRRNRKSDRATWADWMNISHHFFCSAYLLPWETVSAWLFFPIRYAVSKIQNEFLQ